MTTLPTGEQLPEYDGDPADQAVDAWKLYELCVRHAGWPATGVIGRNMVEDVLKALERHSGATLVKNDTYRMLRQDAARAERLTAWLANHGHAEALVRHHGDPAAAATEILDLVTDLY